MGEHITILQQMRDRKIRWHIKKFPLFIQNCCSLQGTSAWLLFNMLLKMELRKYKLS